MVPSTQATRLLREYVEHESGGKGAEKRKQFAALFEDAAKRKFDCVLFWALDRFSREGMAQTIGHLQRLTSYGVTFHSYTEPHLATDNELVRNILLALLSSLAKVEAQKISERTKAGMARAKAKGIKIGRPRLGIELRQKIAKRAAKGETAYLPSPSLWESTGTPPRNIRAESLQVKAWKRAEGRLITVDVRYAPESDCRGPLQRFVAKGHFQTHALQQSRGSVEIAGQAFSYRATPSLPSDRVYRSPR